MLYFVTAHDHADEGAPERRSRVRQAHLDALKPLVDRGTMQVAGVYLDDDGVMRGSMMLIEADNEAAIRTLLEQDVYFRERVWERFDIRPFKRAV
jgi:uncharacterized protein YciI